MAKLTALEIAKIVEPGVHRIEPGLFLQIVGNNRSWLHRYEFRKKARFSGLGSAVTMTLAQARNAMADEKALIRKGVDPVAQRKAERAQAAVEAVKAITFRECAEAYIRAHEPAWKNPKHRQQWTNTLVTYAYPLIGAVAVSEVNTALAMRVLQPVWGEKPETAGRVRGRCEAILDWAKAREYRSGENPFRWRGHLSMLLPAKTKVRKVQHHAAMPYADLPVFMEELRSHEGFSTAALEFTILTAMRTDEVLGLTWDELDLRAKVWTCPAIRMKAGKEHRVPLMSAALRILEHMAELRGTSPFVFQGLRGQLSNMAMLMQLRKLNAGDLTVHGFRSTFRDWAAERTNFASEVVEMALAHAISGKVEAAYRRGDLFDKRRRLMDAWAEYCASPAVTMAEVIPLRA